MTSPSDNIFQRKSLPGSFHESAKQMNTIIPEINPCRRLSSKFGVGDFADDKRREICRPVWLWAYAYFNAWHNLHS